MSEVIDVTATEWTDKRIKEQIAEWTGKDAESIFEMDQVLADVVLYDFKGVDAIMDSKNPTAKDRKFLCRDKNQRIATGKPTKSTYYG